MARAGFSLPCIIQLSQILSDVIPWTELLSLKIYTRLAASNSRD